jgi:membrane protein
MHALRPFQDAYAKFTRDDGWAIASHVALSTLTALFPFLIFLTTLAAFIGREEMALSATNLLFDGWRRSPTRCHARSPPFSPSRMAAC